MEDTVFAKAFAEELEAEVPATHKCLERIPMELSDWKPHEKSMPMGYLALLVAEIPLWIAVILRDSEIDFANFKHYQPKTTEDLVQHFEKNVKDATEMLLKTSEGSLAEPFYLKSDGKVLMQSTKKESITSTINHLVHHRGQLTVYMRLNNIAVPSIYGPSADDKSFGA
jgi:uncharacterized damage-inducible protein DinB